MFFVSFFVSNKLFESDLYNMQTVKKQERWLQYTKSKSIKDQKHKLNHNRQGNSNLIMPFLVQNEDKRPNYTNKWL